MFNFLSRSKRQAIKNGKEGEQTVASVLFQLPREYAVFNNVLLRSKGGTTQIDHVVVSPYGVFVIETKSHKGWIYGDMNGKYWTQVLLNRPHYTFYSPVKQNQGHIKNLCLNLGINSNYMLGIICFSNFSADLTNVNCDCVCKVEYLYNALMNYRKVLFSPNEVNTLCSRLSSSNIESSYQNRKHVKYVKSLK